MGARDYESRKQRKFMAEEACEQEVKAPMGDTKCWDANKRSDSGMRASIEAKGSNSYYYAHAGESIAPPAPVLIGKEMVETDKVRVVNIDRYSFLDDKKKVKIYLEIEGIGASEEKVSCEFSKDTFDLVIKDDELSLRRLWVDDLHCPIGPDKSKFTVKPNKIIVSLHKEVESTWYKLRK